MLINLRYFFIVDKIVFICFPYQPIWVAQGTTSKPGGVQKMEARVEVAV